MSIKIRVLDDFHDREGRVGFLKSIARVAAGAQNTPMSRSVLGIVGYSGLPLILKPELSMQKGRYFRNSYAVRRDGKVPFVGRKSVRRFAGNALHNVFYVV